MRRFILGMSILWGTCFAVGASAEHPIDIQRKTAKGQHYEALVAAARVPDRVMTAPAYQAAARSAWALSLPEKAREHIEKALRAGVTSEEEARLHVMRAVVEFQEQRHQVAILYVEKALDILVQPSPLQSRAWAVWGETLYDLGSYGAAEGKLERALAGAEPSQQAEIYYTLGLSRYRLGNLDSAREAFEHVPLTHRRSPAAIRHLAAIAIDEGRMDSAAFWLKRGRTDFPDHFLDSWVDYALACAAIAEKNLQELNTIQREAEKRFPPSDSWLTLLQGAAEAYRWERLHKREGQRYDS